VYSGALVFEHQWLSRSRANSNRHGCLDKGPDAAPAVLLAAASYDMLGASGATGGGQEPEGWGISSGLVRCQRWWMTQTSSLLRLLGSITWNLLTGEFRICHPDPSNALIGGRLAASAPAMAASNQQWTRHHYMVHSRRKCASNGVRAQECVGT